MRGRRAASKNSSPIRRVRRSTGQGAWIDSTAASPVASTAPCSPTVTAAATSANELRNVEMPMWRTAKPGTSGRGPRNTTWRTGGW
jgi:hypothetical protein